MPERWQEELRKIGAMQPTAGLWDQALEGPRHEPHRAARSRKLTAILLALILVAAATYGLIRTFGPAPDQPGATVQPGRFVDPRFGWTIRYPEGMLLGHFASNGLFTADGAWIANFNAGVSGKCCPIPNMSKFRDFPPDGVALVIWFGERLPAAPPLRDSELPLSPHSFRPIAPYGHGEPAPLFRSFSGDGFYFNTAVWIGPHATQADRRSVWAMVKSLRFPSLREGAIWQERYYVLGLASRYPVGSVTHVTASSLPTHGLLIQHPDGFYLIHAPRAFYAVKQTFENLTDSFSKCTVAFDAKAFQFFCPGTDLRWNRVGRPIGSHAGDGSGWNLPLCVATVSQDGHVLFSPFFGGLLPEDLKGNPWG